MTSGGSPTRKGAHNCFTGLTIATCFCQRNATDRHKQNIIANPSPARVTQPSWLAAFLPPANPETGASLISSASSSEDSLSNPTRCDGKKTGREGPLGI